MNDLQVIAQVVSLLQVGFAGYIAVYLLRFTTTAINDMVKQMAILFEIMGEVRKDVEDLCRLLHSRKHNTSDGE